MTPDLRKILHTAAVRLDSYSAIGFTSEGAATRALADQLRTIADAPPTVAELQVDPRVIAGSHAFVMQYTPTDMSPEFFAIRWGRGEVDGWDGPHEIEAWWFLPCDAGAKSVGLADGWEMCDGNTANRPCDLTQPATLVEVTP